MVLELLKQLGVMWKNEPEGKRIVYADFFKDKNWDLWGDDYAALARACQEPGCKGIFELAGVERNIENQLIFLGNYLNYMVRENMPSALDKRQTPGWDRFVQLNPTMISFEEDEINLFFKGSEALNVDSENNETYSLSRHLMRSVSLTKILLKRIFAAENVELDDKPGLKRLADKYFGGTHPFHLLISAYLHDLPRHITQSSEHDELLVPLANKAGLLPEIVEAIYKIQSCEEVVRDPDLFDTTSQKLIRITDLFAKVIPRSRRNYKYLTTVGEVADRARANQRRYFNEEHDNELTKGSYWYGKNERNFRIYTVNERVLLQSAVEWFERMTGDVISNLFQAINDYPHSFELADQTHVPNEPG